MPSIPPAAFWGEVLRRLNMGLRAFKMALGAMLSITFASFVGLNSPATAGIVVLLSVGKTKRLSIKNAVLRLKAILLALFIGSAIFLILGFSAFSFGIYLLIFLPIAFKFKLDDGIVVSSVLVTHLLNMQSVNIGIISNSLLLFAIGVTVSLLLNLYMPSMQKSIDDDSRWIDEKIRVILLLLAEKISNAKNHRLDFEKRLFDETNTLIENALQKTYADEENHLWAETTYHTNYVLMRKLQFGVLERMSELLDKVETPTPRSNLLYELTKMAAMTLEESNNASALLSELDKVLLVYRNGELPKFRAEFEGRAILFQYLSEFRHFLELKKQFMSEVRSNVRS